MSVLIKWNCNLHNKKNSKKNNYVTEDDYGNSFESPIYEIYIYNNSDIFMVSWGGTDSYLNDENKFK